MALFKVIKIKSSPSQNYKKRRSAGIEVGIEYKKLKKSKNDKM